MTMISTVILPVVALTDTIGDAIKRLIAARTSGLVVIDSRGPVVVTDRSLRNTLVAAGGDDKTPMSRVTSRAFATSQPLFSKSSRSVLASAQDDYVVTDFNTQAATVVTDPKRAGELSQPTQISDLQNRQTV